MKWRILILANNDVFSRAESFVIFCKGQKFATIIGSETGRD